MTKCISISNEFHPIRLQVFNANMLTHDACSIFCVFVWFFVALSSFNGSFAEALFFYLVSLFFHPYPIVWGICSLSLFIWLF